MFTFWIEQQHTKKIENDILLFKIIDEVAQTIRVAEEKHLKNMKPCEIPCSKCGSVDINRTYRSEGEALNRRLNPHEPDTEHVYREELRPFCTIMKAKKEFIEHHCRCCQFDWDSNCLES